MRGYRRNVSTSYPTRTVWMGPPATTPARRIVSLVPSLTEAVFQIGVADRLVARTEYCVRPRGLVDAIESVGGTKNPKTARIGELAPDIILANKEENRQKHIEDLARDFPVWLTDPVGPGDVPALWEELGDLVGRPEVGERFARDTTTAIDAARNASTKLTRCPRFVYFVWKDPWMVAGHETYISNLLCACGFENALDARHSRFPVLTPEEISSVQRDVTIYSSEPYNFELPRDLIDGAIAESVDDGWYRTDAGLALFVDAEPLSWYPSLTVEGLAYASKLATRAASLIS
ncbi:MAG: ABC transporter substrate-binding protein [Deltaproteobacteria bacterium]|nr:ABC transporter substrate-binding protein [Deltaproteobacteria bacterium]